MRRDAFEPRLYILDEERRPVRCRDLILWAHYFETGNNRHVDMTQITSSLTVSTIFLGLDHRHFGDGPPILFETMTFVNGCADEQYRYSSWDDAQAGHRATVKRLRQARKAMARRVSERTKT